MSKRKHVVSTMILAPLTEVKKAPLKDLPPYIGPYNDRYICKICDAVLHSEQMLVEHILGRKHLACLKKVEVDRENQECSVITSRLPYLVPGTPQKNLPRHIIPFKGQYKCMICELRGPLNSIINVEDHVGGRRHSSSLREVDESRKHKSTGYAGPVKLAVDQNIAYNKPREVQAIAVTNSGEEHNVTVTSRTFKKSGEEDATVGKHPPPKSKLPSRIKPFGTKYKCNACNLVLDSLRMVEQHAEGKRHFRSMIISRLRNNRSWLIKDKHGVEVRCASEEQQKKKGVTELTLNIQDMEVIESLNEQFTIVNKGKNVVYLHNVAYLRDRPFYKLKKPEGLVSQCPLEMAPGQVVSLNVIVAAKKIGRYHTILILRLKRRAVREDIFIIREIQTRVVNTLVLDSDPTAPYIPPPRISVLPQMEVIDGERPKTHRSEQLERELELKKYFVPKLTRAAVNSGMPMSHKDGSIDAELNRIRMLMDDEKPSSKRIKEYHSRMSALLHLEELQMEVDIRVYDLKNVQMTRDGKLLELQVPGLAENRPSVLRGDHIFVEIIRSSGEPEDIEYKGYVHQVKLDSVLLGFSNKLLAKFIVGMKFNVRFTFNRLPLMLQHRATELAGEHFMEKLLFPQPDTICTWRNSVAPKEAIKKFFDRSIEANTEQATAVRHIVAGSSRPAPYLIFGPPGTGKTVTVVESIKQVLECIPGAHVLACAPSNSAADLITQRVAKHVQKSKIFRIYAASRNWSDVPEDIRDISNYDKNEGDYFYPSKEDICKKRVVVVTMVTAGRLVSANFPPNHFTHVFIDEAGHAFESEAMIAVAGILDSIDGGQLVLAGDPKQLGPIVRSPHAKEFELDISLLERLMKTEPFQRSPFELDNSHYNARVLTKLLDNYRSHPVIIDTSNKLFYDGELRVCADEMAREAFCRWEELPKKNFPIIFHGVVGKEVREGHSPSWFNPEEVAHVYKYVEKLMTARGTQKLQQTDVGIIAPYRQQVVKIKQVLRKKNYNKIKVGSVEEFQGQERKVIIISTVRSSPEYLEKDDEFKLGFLANAKKFNVATTRAKALMIVIGNPNLLQRDPADCWNKFLDFCLDNDCYKGIKFVPLEKDQEQVGKRAIELNFGEFMKNLPDEKPDPMAASIVQTELHPSWRGEDQT